MAGNHEQTIESGEEGLLYGEVHSVLMAEILSLTEEEVQLLISLLASSQT